MDEDFKTDEELEKISSPGLIKMYQEYRLKKVKQQTKIMK